MATNNPTNLYFTGDGATTQFTFTFPYLSPAHVKATVDGEPVEVTLISPSVAEITPAPADQTTVRIYRETPETPIVNWADGAVILGRHLNAAQTQSLYIAQEAMGVAANLSEEAKQYALDGVQEAVNAAVDSAAELLEEAISDELLAAQQAKTGAENARDAAGGFASDAQGYASTASGKLTAIEALVGDLESAALDAENEVKNFKRYYIGSYASPPTLDPFGDALIEGAIYFDTVEDGLRVWDGASWQAAYFSVELPEEILASTVANDSAVPGTYVKDALNALNSGKADTTALANLALADGSNITGRLGGTAQNIDGGDWNNADQTGFYTHGSGNPAANAPVPSTAFYGLTIRQSSVFAMQLAWERGSAAPRQYIRVRTGSWGAWQPLPRRFATQGEAEAGTAQDVAMSPLRTAQAIAAQAAAKTHTHAQSDITNLTADLAAKVPTSRSVSASGLASGGGDLTVDRTITVSKASAAEFRAGTEDGKALTPKGPWDAAAIVALTDAGTITVNMANFINAEVTLGGNRTLGNPSNAKVGQSGSIRIVQDGTGGRTLAFSGNWKFAGGIAPSLTAAANAVDILHYKVHASDFIEASLAKNVK